MASLSMTKTSKFSILDSIQTAAPPLKKPLNVNSVTVGAGKRISMADVVGVAIHSYHVEIDLAGLDVVTEASSVFGNDLVGAQSTPLPAVYGRAILFARIVSLVQGRSQIRPAIIQHLVDVLNANVVPLFSSQSSAETELLGAILGKDGFFCATTQGLKSAAAAYVQNGLVSPILTKLEASTLTAGTYFQTGVGCLVATASSSLVSIADSVAALSCECFGASIEPFDGSNFEYRQHRGQMASSTSLRSLLEGSKRVNKPKVTARDQLKRFAAIPQIVGPAQEHIAQASRCLEIELNSAENGPVAEDGFGFDASQVILSIRATAAALYLLQQASVQRVASVTGSGDVPTEPFTAVDADELVASIQVLEKTRTAFAVEVYEAIRVLGNPPAAAPAADVPSVVSDSAPAKKAAKKPEVDDSKYTPEQLAKAEAKRKQKEEKAAQKAAEKNAKKAVTSGGDGAAVLPLGAGTEALRVLILARCGKGADQIQPEDLLQTVIDPFAQGIDSFASQCTTLIEKLGSGGKRRPKIAKGARDFGPEQMRIREQAFAAIRRVFKRHGGVEIDTPVFELKEVLTGKYGEDSKLIYDLADQGGELLSLRYDLTVPFARFLAMNSVGNIKRYHIAKVYRRDQPQQARGRYREFYQCDFDIAGSFSVMVADAEVLSVATEILSDLPVGPFLIKLNHRRLLDAIFDICGVPMEKFRPICSAVDKLDKAPWEEVKAEMVGEKGLPEHVADRIGQFVLHSGSPKVLWAQLMGEKKFGEHAGALGAMEELRILFDYLDAMGRLPHISFDLSLARGLDYYTGVIYEAVLTDGTSQVGSIAAGGRYDNLVGMFSPSGTQTPCVGVSIGVERVFTILEKKANELNLLQASSTIQVFIASIGPALVPERMRVAQLLWQANISAEYSHQDNPKFKKQLDEALERAIPFMVVFGTDELANGTVKVKDMRNKTEDEVPLAQVVEVLLGKGCVSIPPGADLSFLTAMR